MINHETDTGLMASGSATPPGLLFPPQVDSLGPSEGRFLVEVVLDHSNVAFSLRKRGCSNPDYGLLVQSVVRKLAGRLGLPVSRAPLMSGNEHIGAVAEKTTAFCRNVWCVASVPVNTHPDDWQLVRSVRLSVARLRRKHGFLLEQVPFNFCGFHMRAEDRQKSELPEERSWEAREALVDVAVATLLFKRCMAPDRPAAAVLMSGDAHFASLLREIPKCQPNVRVVVAAFSEALSTLYRPQGRFGYTWREDPILLDECLGGQDREEQ